MSPVEINLRNTMIRLLHRFGFTERFLNSLTTDKLEALTDLISNDIENSKHNPEAVKYANLIEPTRETYAQTVKRLSDAMGKRVDTDVFYEAVRIIRYRYSDIQKIL